jgi:hypothetical protein
MSKRAPKTARAKGAAGLGFADPAANFLNLRRYCGAGG